MAISDVLVTLVRIAQKDRGLNDHAYRLLLHNVAGVTSTKALTNATVEGVMSVMEGLGFEDGKHGRGYWSGKVAARGTYANARMVHKLRELAAQVDRYPLAAMCRRHSDGRTDDPAALTPREAWKLIEGYKAIGAREDAKAAPAGSAPVPDTETDENVPF